jgi:DNA-binding transcriptional LysR family regulator
MRSKDENISLRQIEIFCCVARTENFSKAAHALYLTQPTVSEHIAQLEKILGAKLFDRLGRRTTLTSAGQVYLDHACQILKLRTEAREALWAFLGSLQGELHIGASNIPGTYLLPPIIAGFLERYPKVLPKIKISGTQEIIEAVQDGRFDLGFVGLKQKVRHVAFTEFVKDRLVAVAAPSHPLTRKKRIPFERLVEEPFIIREAASGTRMALEKELRKHKFNPDRDLHLVLIAGSNEAVKQAIKAGVGISILSRFSVHEELSNGTLTELKVTRFSIKRSFYLIRNTGRSLSPAANAFFELCASEKDAYLPSI